MNKVRYSHIMNVVDADKRKNSHLDIPYRSYLLNDFFMADADPSMIWVSMRINMWFGIEFIVFGK